MVVGYDCWCYLLAGTCSILYSVHKLAILSPLRVAEGGGGGGDDFTVCRFFAQQ